MIGDVQEVLQVALGGMPLTTTVEGLQRYDINMRYSRDFRESLGALREIIVPTATGVQVPLGQLAKIEDGACADGNKERSGSTQCLDLCGCERHGRWHLCANGQTGCERGD